MTKKYRLYAACRCFSFVQLSNFRAQKAGVTGFQLWIVVRSILENCKTVDEAVHWAMDAPIGFNINLMLADSCDRIALLQCIDGHKSYEILDGSSDKTYLTSTNHQRSYG